jgi:hypothetical protein
LRADPSEVPCASHLSRLFDREPLWPHPDFRSGRQFITAWHQFGQPSSICVGPDDTLYVGAAFREEAMRRNDAPAAADRVITDADGARARRVMGHRATQ